MTVKPVKGASVPPVTSRNSVIAAVPAITSPGAKSVAMLMKELTTTNFYCKKRAGHALISCMSSSFSYNLFYFTINSPLSQPSLSTSHPTADLLFLSSRQHTYHICRKDDLHSQVTAGL